jgi:hypothetical protein
MSRVLTLLQWAIGVIGIVLIYLSFSYESEDGKIQNLLEEWWIRVNDYRHQLLSRHVAFIKMLASVTSNIFDKLFGVLLVSLQALGVSICYSFICLGVMALVVRQVREDAKITVGGSIALIAEGVIWGILPALISPLKIKKFGVTPIRLWFVAFLIAQLWGLRDILGSAFMVAVTMEGDARLGASIILAFFFLFLCGFLLFAVFLAIMRQTLRTIANSTSPMRIVGLSLLNAVPVLFLVTLFLIGMKVSDYLGKTGIWLAVALIFASVLGMGINFAFLLSGAFFVILSATMLFHRLFWPVIERPLYKLQALGISKRPRVFIAIGIILVGVGFGKFEWLKYLLDKF